MTTGEWYVNTFDPVIFTIGIFQLRWYPLAYVVGVILGWMYILHLIKKTPGVRPSSKDMDDFLVWAVLGIIAGGRLFYVLFYNLDHYLQYPMEIPMVWKGGMSFHGGLVGITLALILFALKRGFSPFRLGDLVAAAGPIGFFFGRLANFVNGELYGHPTNVPWAVVFPHVGAHQPRHPSQLYEAALEGILLFIVLAILMRISAVRQRPGLVAGVFFIGYGLSRIFVEFFREPDVQLGYLWGVITMGQLLCLPMIMFGGWLVTRALVKPRETIV